ncbi:MAG: DUF1998 domain-containing protein [Christensenellales bacterium]|nr:DUF1998 domain-containing protein [Christensenellales bacterium]
MKAPIKIEMKGTEYNVRAAQAILQYGVGAMVDFQDQTLMTAAPEYWGDKRDLCVFHDERLEKALGVKWFAHPRDKNDPSENGIAYSRFPRWYFCPKCRRLEPLSFWIKEYNQNKSKADAAQKDKYMKNPVCMIKECMKDRRGRVPLVPARIIVACENGHIDDFPWIEWVHSKSNKQCNNPHMQFLTGANTSAGLEGIKVRCITCEANDSLEHAFDKDYLWKRIKDYKCSGYMPWKGKREKNCYCCPQTKQRGASSVYYPKIDSSLVIPPYSERLRKRILSSQAFDDCFPYIRACIKHMSLEEAIDSACEEMAGDVAKSIFEDKKTVQPILKALLRGRLVDGCETLDVSSEVYRQAEYSALNGDVSQQGEDDDFRREERTGSDYDILGVTKVALLHKIREVRALVGFSRLNPPFSGELGIPSIETKRFQCVKDNDTPWYPGYEVRGEGIFIQFDNDLIENWLKNSSFAQKQISKLEHNLQMIPYGRIEPFNAKFVFLHTLAHLLIQRLSFDCGYSTASLRERIYCDIEHPEFPMCGIFIYTACGDSEGTLGGLVRYGIPERLRKVFMAALEGAMWCSNDPVCSGSGGQGRNAMNLAACHACALLPETSCERFNILLDRSLLIGKVTDRNVGFYSNWIKERIKEEPSAERD